MSFINDLEGIIDQRLHSKDPNSYVYTLLEKGLDRILKKIGEEAGEVIIAAKNNDPVELKNEAADLLFHLLLVLKHQGLSFEDVLSVLKERS